MFIKNITDMVPKEIIWKISLLLKRNYPVNTQRIYNLILQVNSVDVAIELLIIHSNLNITLDNILYQYLKGRDETYGVERKRFDKRFNKGKFESWYKELGNRKNRRKN